MPFCDKAAKRHCKGLTIDDILGNVYNRLELHTSPKIDLRGKFVINKEEIRHNKGEIRHK